MAREDNILNPPRPSEIAVNITGERPASNPYGNDPRGSLQPHIIPDIVDIYIRHNPSWEDIPKE